MEKYREGTLSDAERDELNGLAHRDEVMAAAGERAHGILRRRRTVAFTVAGLLVAGGAIWTLLPSERQQAPILAETTVPEVVERVPEPTVEQVAPATMPTEEKVVAKVTRRSTVAPSQVKPVDAVVKPEESDDPVVMCNNQCEADSVINDIWKFLTV